MLPKMTVEDRRVAAMFDQIGPNVHQALIDALTPIAAEIASDTRTRAAAHIHSWGAKAPGSYVTSFKGGVATKTKFRATGWVRSGHPLAHLMELGFTIKDWMIVPGTGKYTASQIGAIMAFAGGAVDVFRKAVHRHATRVPAFPALEPAFAARKADIMAAFERVAREAGQGAS